MWPLIFIALGISIIAKSKRKNDWQAFQQQQKAAEEDKKADFSDAVATPDDPTSQESKETITTHPPQL